MFCFLFCFLVFLIVLFKLMFFVFLLGWLKGYTAKGTLKDQVVRWFGGKSLQNQRAKGLRAIVREALVGTSCQ